MKKKSFPLSRVYQLLEPGPVVMVTTADEKKANVMTLSWQTMLDFEPPLLCCVVGEQSYSFTLIKKSKECVINIPTKEILSKVIGVGNTTGRKIDKFKKFQLTKLPASKVNAPLIKECYANLECKVIDTRMVKKYNLFILEVVKAWISPLKKEAKTIHHQGNGVFVADGEIIKTDSKMK